MKGLPELTIHELNHGGHIVTIIPISVPRMAGNSARSNSAQLHFGKAKIRKILSWHRKYRHFTKSGSYGPWQ